MNKYPHGHGNRPCRKMVVGEIVYIQDNLRPLGGFPSWRPVVRTNPWIIEAWKNREYSRPGMQNTHMRGGHLAVVRSLRNGKRKVVADWMLEMSQEVGG